MFKYWVYRFGQFCVRHLPIQTAYTLAGFVSDLHYYFSFRDRRAVRSNLRTILGKDTNIEAPVREVFRNFGKYLVEFFRMDWEADSKFIRENVKIKNFDRLEEALKRGKGVIVLTAHIGNWEFGGVVLSKLGYPSLAIALPHKERPVNDLFNRQREIHGITIVPVSQSVRKCFKTLKANKLISLLADRDFTANGEVLPFLGREALIPKGAAIFASRTGATILPSFFTRESDNTFTLTIEAPINVEEIVGLEDPEAILRIMKEYAAVIERKVREHPTQWMMFREFWLKQKLI